MRFEGLPFCYNSADQLLGGSYQIGVSTHLAFTASVPVLPNPIVTLVRVSVDAGMAEEAMWITALPAAHGQSFQRAISLERRVVARIDGRDDLQDSMNAETRLSNRRPTLMDS